LPFLQILELPEQCHIALWHISDTDLENSKPENWGEFRQSIYGILLQKLNEKLHLQPFEILKDDYNKPHASVEGYNISISHSKNLIGLAFSSVKEVGLDLEIPREKLWKVLDRICSQKELEICGNNLELATKIWSAKESLYKLYGKRGLIFKEDLELELEGESIIGYIKKEGPYLLQFSMVLGNVVCLGYSKL
jgi:phosphopantetheinyl transferase